MNKDLAIRMAIQELPGGPSHVQMTRANEIHAANNTEGDLPPFAQVDIVFAEFGDYLKSCPQRERDLVTVSELLSKVWSTAHITIQTLKERPSMAEAHDAQSVVLALHRLNLLHLLTNGLNETTQAWVATFLPKSGA